MNESHSNNNFILVSSVNTSVAVNITHTLICSYARHIYNILLYYNLYKTIHYIWSILYIILYTDMIFIFKVNYGYMYYIIVVRLLCEVSSVLLVLYEISTSRVTLSLYNSFLCICCSLHIINVRNSLKLVVTLWFLFHDT